MRTRKSCVFGEKLIVDESGKASSEPLLPENPGASANRRLSIPLLR